MSNLEDRIRVEDMEDRDILLELLATNREQNGTVAKIMSDYYGDAERSVVGTKPQAEANTKAIAEARTVWKTIVGGVSLVGVGTVAALLKAF